MMPETLENQPSARVPTLKMDETVVQGVPTPLIDEALRLMPVVDPVAGTLRPIASREEYKILDILVGKLTAGRKLVKGHVETFFKKHIENATKALQDLRDDRTDYLEIHDQPLAIQQENAVRLMRIFETEESAREKARKDEADRLLKIQQQEAVKKAEQDRQDQLKRDEDMRLAKASQAEANGDTATAERILNAPPPPPPPPPRPILSTYVPSGLPLKASSASTRKNWTWKAEGEDQRAAVLKLIKAAAENPDAFQDFLTFDDKALKERAKSKEAQARVPGIEFYDDRINTNRAGRA